MNAKKDGFEFSEKKFQNFNYFYILDLYDDDEIRKKIETKSQNIGNIFVKKNILIVIHR